MLAKDIGWIASQDFNRKEFIFSDEILVSIPVYKLTMGPSLRRFVMSTLALIVLTSHGK